MQQRRAPNTASKVATDASKARIHDILQPPPLMSSSYQAKQLSQSRACGERHLLQWALHATHLPLGCLSP